MVAAVLVDYFSTDVCIKRSTSQVHSGLNKTTSNAPFPEFKTTGDEKHDLETYNEDLIDYSVVQNWYDVSKESEAAKWTNHDFRIRKNQITIHKEKKSPKLASCKKYREPSCQSRR